MDKEISPATRERIRKLCGQIRVAHDLDPEIQEELSGHFEDKLLAYLAGEETLSEEDAYMLTRRHFGDAAALKELLQNVHDRSVYASLARRLTAVLVAAVSLSLLVSAITNVARVALALWAVHADTQQEWAAVAGLCVRATASLAFVVLLWCQLARWQRQLTQGRHLWFVRWPARRMWALVAAAVIAPHLMPVVVSSYSQRSSNPVISTLLAVSEIAPLLLGAFAWLWWSDRRPRAHRGLLAAALSWTVFQISMVFSPRLVPVVIIGLEPATYLGRHVDTLAQGPLFNSSLWWSFASREAVLVSIEKLQSVYPYVLAANVAGMALAALVALALYGALRFASSRIAKRYVRRQAIV